MGATVWEIASWACLFSQGCLWPAISVTWTWSKQTYHCNRSTFASLSVIISTKLHVQYIISNSFPLAILWVFCFFNSSWLLEDLSSGFFHKSVQRANFLFKFRTCVYHLTFAFWSKTSKMGVEYASNFASLSSLYKDYKRKILQCHRISLLQDKDRHHRLPAFAPFLFSLH